MAATEQRTNGPVILIAPLPRKYYCACGRFLGEGTVTSGYLVVKCQKCGYWRKLDFSCDRVT
jgi:hypothetical protein